MYSMPGSMGDASEGSWLCGFGIYKDGWNGVIISVVTDLKVEVKPWKGTRKAKATAWTE